MTTDSSHAEMPEGWRTFPLQSLCLKTEFTDPTKRPHQSFRYIDVTAVSNGLWKIVNSTEHTGSTAPSRARKLVKASDVIFATVRPTLRRVAMVPDYLDGQVVSTAFCVIRAKPTLADARFIYYSLLTDEFLDRIGNMQRGASYPAVTDGDVLRQEILVPPFPEQLAIATVLSKIQATVEVQEKIVAKLKELKAATMAKLFREGLGDGTIRETRFGEVPAHWKATLLSECTQVQTGVAKGRRINDAPTCELPYLRVANVQDGYLDLSEIKTIVLRKTEVPRYSLEFGDVLLTEGGDFDKLGRGYLWKGQIPNCVHQNHIFAVRTNRNSLIPEFFAYQAQSAYGKAYFLSVAHKTTNLACINSSKLKAFPVLLPELSEQREIASILEKIDQRINLELYRLGFLRSLFSSMLHLLMTGQVRLSPKVIALQSAAARKTKPKRNGRAPDPKLLDEIVRRIVDVAAPEKIILFGSAARGEMGPDSDLDILVIKSCQNQREVAQAIRRLLIGIGTPKDIVVVTPEDLEEHKDIPGYVIGPALREGKVLYAA